MSCSTHGVPYGGKFSLVQNFTELPPSPSEENFVVLNFALESIIRTRKFTVLIFTVADLSAKTAKIWTMLFAISTEHCRERSFFVCYIIHMHKNVQLYIDYHCLE